MRLYPLKKFPFTRKTIFFFQIIELHVLTKLGEQTEKIQD